MRGAGAAGASGGDSSWPRMIWSSMSPLRRTRFETRERPKKSFHVGWPALPTTMRVTLRDWA